MFSKKNKVLEQIDHYILNTDILSLYIIKIIGK